MELLVARARLDQILLHLCGFNSPEEADWWLQELSRLQEFMVKSAKGGTDWAIDRFVENDLTNDFTTDPMTSSMWAVHGRLQEIIFVAGRVKLFFCLPPGSSYETCWTTSSQSIDEVGQPKKVKVPKLWP